ncbi:DUF7555 family protein [Halobacteriaceae archaeon SHR40]|uniref:DUF7555 family protein n=1 Tax=Halovenus amylolytica TaxID=2500550 RepID=UPI000FE3C0C5
MAVAATYVFVYALAVALLAIVGAGIAAAATGGGLVRMKVILFVIGWLLMAYATVRLWPSSPDALESDSTPTTETIPEFGSRSRFEAVVYELPPAKWLPVPEPELRTGSETKLFLGSLLVFLSSFLLETIFGAT